MFSVCFRIHRSPPELAGAPAPPAAQPKTTLLAELTDSVRVDLPNPAVTPPNHQPQSSTASAPTADSTSFNQPSVTSPTRQRLGEDLFRLVQVITDYLNKISELITNSVLKISILLQHINYMSLGEVLGASFSNLQRAQQSSSVAPPGMSSSQTKMPSSSAKIIPEPNVSPVQNTIAATPQTQESAPKPGSSDSQFHLVTSCELADQPVMQNAAQISSGANQYHAKQTIFSRASGAGVSYQVKV